MFSRLLLAFSLIVSFGVAQIGAISHELSHYQTIALQQAAPDATEQNAPSPSPLDSLPHTQVCEKCISYTEVNPLHYQHAVLDFTNATSHHYTHLNSPAFHTQHHAVYAARAPPYFA